MWSLTIKKIIAIMFVSITVAPLFLSDEAVWALEPDMRYSLWASSIGGACVLVGLTTVTADRCCGFIANNQFALVTHVAFMTFIMMACVYLAFSIKNICGMVEDLLTRMFQDSSSRNIFMLLEEVFHCCGTTGPDSYKELSLPLSTKCCRFYKWNNLTMVTDTNVTTIQFCATEDAYAGGCLAPVMQIVTVLGSVALYLLVTIIFVQLMGIGSVSYLVFNIKPQQFIKYQGAKSSKPRDDNPPYATLKSN